MRVMFDKLCRRAVLVAFLLVPFVATGCGHPGAELADVSGTVRMDGQPLPDALVEFQPDDGSPSFGRTDAEGHYYLQYSKDRDGARPGKHIVRIKPAEVFDEDGERVQTNIKIPPRYFRKSELSAVVESGSNTVDFDLTSN